MDIKRINELGRIIEDAQKKMDICEAKLLNGEGDRDFIHDMLFMNMERRDLCRQEITKLTGKARI